MQQPIPQKWCSLATYKRIEENREREREKKATGKSSQFFTVHVDRRERLYRCALLRGTLHFEWAELVMALPLRIYERN